MQIEAFLLCDAATDSQGKLNLLGAFDVIGAVTFPVTHPACTVVARMRFQRIEKGAHQVVIHFVDEDGQFVIPPFNGNIDLQIGGEDRSATVNMIINLQGLTFKHAGEYTVALAIDGREAVRLPLRLKDISKAAT